MTLCSCKASPELHDAAALLSEYAASLLGCGAICIRLVKNVRRIAASWGYEVELTIMPRRVHLYIYSEHIQIQSSASVKNTRVSFHLNTELSRLSWQVADSHLDVNQTRTLYSRILEAETKSATPHTTLLIACAGAAFCGLFGGDIIAVLTVWCATLSGVYLKGKLLKRGFDLKLAFIVCSFISAVFGASDLLFGLGQSPQVALGTSILYLVPGIPFINSFSDMLYGHYICALCRMADAIILTCCLSIGLCSAMILMNYGMF